MSAPRRASLSSVATSCAWQMARNSGTRAASQNTCRARFRSHRPVPAQEGLGVTMCTGSKEGGASSVDDDWGLALSRAGYRFAEHVPRALLQPQARAYA